MRRAARTDANHAEVRDGIRKHGIQCRDMSKVGGGFPDLIVAWAPNPKKPWTAVIEVKDGDKVPSDRKLTAAEQEFKDSWPGRYILALDVNDAVTQIVTAYKEDTGS